MKNKRIVLMSFSAIFAVAAGAYLLVHFVFGIKQISVSPSSDEIGKIKYVDSNGNNVFASTAAVVFESPINFLEIEIENDIAHITGLGFSIVRAPAYGVVESADNATVVINHGNSTFSTVSGLLHVGVKEGDLLSSGQPIGSTAQQVDFSVVVSELPMDMQWLFGSVIE